MSITAQENDRRLSINGLQKPFALYIENLTVSFDGFKAVDNLSLYVDEGEIRVIIGPNGAGKTTVLDLICGKTRASGGSIKFRDKELTRLKEHEIIEAGVGQEIPESLDLRRTDRLRKPGTVLPPWQRRFGNPVFQARRGPLPKSTGNRRNHLSG